MGYRKQVPFVWQHNFGPSEAKRAVGAFIGTFMVLFGARMANGCASGHILSGNIQMAVSSFLFLVMVMIGAWIALRYIMHLKINAQGYVD